jgi:hypothetical protein
MHHNTIDKFLEEVHACLLEAHDYAKCHYNSHHRELGFKVCD